MSLLIQRRTEAKFDDIVEDWMAGPGGAGNGARAEQKSAPPGFTDVDYRILAATTRKNAEAIVQISQLALDGMQHAWRRQLDFAREAIEELSSFVVEMGDSNGSLEQRLSRQADQSKQSFERILVNARDLTELTFRSTSEAMAFVSQRLTDGLDELRRAQLRREP